MKSEEKIWRPRILLVDDHRENLLALESLLKDENVEIVKALSGDDALEKLLDGPMALAILDVQMPSMSGLELAELMRGAERTKRIPIIFLTAGNRDESVKFEGYDRGAVDFLYKPVEPLVFLSKVRVFVELATQRRELEVRMAELKEARDEARAANRAKSEFLANMSHEIRTPLGAILGFADLALVPGQTPEELKISLNAIRRNGRQLLGILNDILDLSKIEAGKILLEEIDIDLGSLLSDLKQTFSSLAEEKGLRFEIDTGAGLPASIESDPTRLRQILMNLLSNAVKFTTAGEIRLRVEAKSDKVGDWIFFSIRDTGIGISPEQAEKLFEPFVQADGSMSRRFGGTGLGLAISLRLSESLGGRVDFESKGLNQGSVFTLRLLQKSPRGKFDPASVKSIKQPFTKTVGGAAHGDRQLVGFRLLLVEDSADNREVVSRFLGVHGAEIEFAHDGEEAIRRCDNGNYDLVLMDLQMPELDGFEATRRLRAKGFRKPIVALTAHGMKEERDRCIEVGCNAHIVKPVDSSLLIETVRSLVNASQANR